MITSRSRIAHASLRVPSALLVLSLGRGVSSPSAPPAYHVTQELRVDSGAFDFVVVDPVGRRLYGANYKVVDIDSLRVIGEVPPHTGHGFAIATDLGRGLGRRGVIFDLKTLTLVDHVAASGDGSYYDPSTHRAFLLDTHTTVVDLVHGTIVDTIGFREDRYVSVKSATPDGSGRLFVTIWHAPDTLTRGISVIAVVDTRSLQITTHWSVPGCFQARAISFDKAADRLFVSCETSVAVLAASDGRLVATVPVAGAADQSAFDEGAQRFIVPTPTGRVAIVYREHDDVYGVVTTDRVPGARDVVALDPMTHRLFLPTQRRDSVGVTVLTPQ